MRNSKSHPMARRIQKVVVGFLVTTSIARGQSGVAVIQIGPFDGGDLSEAKAVNNVGLVAGNQFFGSVKHAFIWNEGQYTDLGSLNGRNTEPNDINEQSQVVGYSNIVGFDGHAFLWSKGLMIDLGTLGGDESVAYAISETGKVVGLSDTEPGVIVGLGFQWQNGVMEALVTLGGRDSIARGITSDGALIVGTANRPDQKFHATLWTDPQIVIDLGTLNNDGYSQAYSINNAGDIVGYSGNGGNDSHAFLWRNGAMIDIHRRSISESSNAYGINNRGEIVGSAYGGNGGRAAYWTPNLYMIDLNDALPPKSDWVLKVAWDINDLGQIACQAQRGGPLNLIGALVTPVHPTMDLAAPVPGTVGVANTIAISGVTPGARVAFLYSLHGGGTRIDGCDLQQNALQLDHPKLIGTAIADANGNASITRHVPLVARGQYVLFQAVVQGECAISQLVVWQFQ